MNKIIVFEGLDGAGKSTLLSTFSEIAPNYKQLYSVPDSLSAIRGIVDKTENPLAALHFFGLCNLIRSEEMKVQLDEGQSIVLDRYIFTTLAYQYLMIGENIMKWFDLVFQSNKILLPDFVILVTARPEIIAQRIQKRDGQNSHKKEWYGDAITLQQGQKLRDAYIKFLELSGVKWIEFDTSDYTIEQQKIELKLILGF